MKAGDKIVLVAGARPNFVKVAALDRAFRSVGFDICLVHTGQHYDTALSDVFFEQLGLPEPNYHLEVGSAPHGQQTGKVMIAFEPVMDKERPDAVVVVGDVNSTLACALVAAKMVYPDGSRPLAIHVEAGLRSSDRTMPEEVNRAATDHVCHVLFASEPTGVNNLLNEGVAGEKIHLVGNVMIDTLRRLESQALKSEIVDRLGLSNCRYGLVTMHRPSNVDRLAHLAALVQSLNKAAQRLPLLMATHPRTQKMLAEAGLNEFSEPVPGWAASSGLALTGPLPYLDFLRLMMDATVVITDSGGIQEETTALGIPCLTVRPNTERPITIAQGTNRLVSDTKNIVPELEDVLANPTNGRVPDMWDGKAAERVAEVLLGLDGTFRAVLKKA